jgi:uncharacterized membrane protein YqjE
MGESTVSLEELAAASKQLTYRGLAIGATRIELLMVELEEERQRLLHAIHFALVAALFSLLAGITLTAAIVVWLWAKSPVAVLLILTVIYAATAAAFFRKLSGLLRDQHAFSASLQQLQKDRLCLEKILA